MQPPHPSSESEIESQRTSAAPASQVASGATVQNPIYEPDPVRTAAEILGAGFWSYIPDEQVLQISERGKLLLGASAGTEARFLDLLRPDDADLFRSRLRSYLRFELVVRSLAGVRALLRGWPERGSRPRMAGTIDELPRAEQPVTGSSDSLVLSAVEQLGESFLLLRAIRDVDHAILDFEVQELNLQAANDLGRPREAAQGKLIGELAPSDTATSLIQQYSEVIRSGSPVSEEFHAAPGGLQQIWIRRRIVPVGDGVAVFSNDVTASRIGVESDQRTKQMLERVASTAPDLLILWDRASKRFLYKNRTANSFGAQGDLRSLNDLIANVVSEDRDKLRTYLDALSDQAVASGTFRFIGREGVVTFQLRTSVFDWSQDEKPKSYLTSIQDVTHETSDRSDLEARMNELAQARRELQDKQQILEELNAKLAQDASTDSLTGIKNRRSFDEKLEEEVERAQRYNLRLALLIADVDNFKIYNDTYGHPAGDDVLKEFAKVLTEVCRKSDTVSRYGGEEFSIILPNTGAEEAARLGERIRESLAQTAFASRGVTASIGCAEFTTGKDGLRHLVEDADKALYESKQAGKDRVTVRKA